MAKFIANKDKFLSLLFNKYFGFSIKKNFYRVNINGIKGVNEMIYTSNLKNIPIVLCLNHSHHHWDAALIYWLSVFLKLDSHYIVEEQHIKKHIFLNHIGAIPIIRENPSHSLKALNFAIDLIKNSNKALWIFPQGEIAKNEKFPLRFFNGVSYLIEKLQNVILISVHVEYLFTSEQRPEIFINFFDKSVFENIEFSSRKDFTACLEKKFEREILKFRDLFLNSELNDYQTILKGKLSIDKRRAH